MRAAHWGGMMLPGTGDLSRPDYEGRSLGTDTLLSRPRVVPVPLLL